MRKRLYFLLPTLESAHKVVDELLLARIDVQHIHVMAKEGQNIGDLPEASLFQKSDIVHGIETGMVIGGLSGLIGSLAVITVLQPGSSTKNTRLKEFEQAMEEGKILIMADVPMIMVDSVTHKVEAHKQVITAGEDPSIPAFP